MTLSDSGELTLCPGTWYAVVEVDHAIGVSIRGIGGRDAVVVSGGAAWTPLVGTVDGSLDVVGVTVEDGVGAYGGCISIDGPRYHGDVTLDDAVLQRCEATTAGATCGCVTPL